MSSASPTPPDRPENGEITQLLGTARAGDEAAADELLGRVYDQLHRMAEGAFAARGGNETLQPTVIVHDAFLRLLGSDAAWTDRAHFFAVAAKAMRQLLTDHARAKKARKRGGDWQRVSFFGLDESEEESPLDTIALDEALTTLASLSERQARVVELRFFAGLEIEEVARVLGVSRRTIINEWRTARAFLRARLGGDV